MREDAFFDGVGVVEIWGLFVCWDWGWGWRHGEVECCEEEEGDEEDGAVAC